jgi:hypothetical protein
MPDLLARRRIWEIEVLARTVGVRAVAVPVGGGLRHSRRTAYAYGEYGGDSYEDSQ